MAFNFLKNPFERLSADNQKEMKEELKELNKNLTSKDGILGIMNVVANNTGKMVTSLQNIHKAILDIKSKNTKADKKELKLIGKAASVLGSSLEKIISAIKMFSKLPDEVIDKFVQGIAKISESFDKLGKSLKKLQIAHKVLTGMAKGIFFFGLALLISGPIYLLALPLGILVIGVILGVLWLFDHVLGNKKGLKNVLTGAKALSWMALGIITFGLALLLAGPIYKAAMSSSLLLVAAVILGAFGLMYLLGTIFNKELSKGIESLMWLGLAIVVFGIALVGASFIYEYLWNEHKEGMMVIGLVILSALGVMIILSKLKGDIYDGAKAMIVMAISVVVLAIALWTFSKIFPANKQNWETLGLVGAAVGGLSVVLIAMGLVKTQVMSGAIALILSSVAVILLAVGLSMFTKTVNSGYGWEQYGLLMATVAGIGIEFGLIGIPIVAGFVALGAITMMLASVSIIVLGVALEKWRKIGFTDTDAKDLQKAITRIPMAFLGLTGDEGFLGAIAQAAKTTVIMAAATVNSLMMIGISMSLLTIGSALRSFKDLGFTTKDSDNIKYVITSISSAFVSATSDNKDFKWTDVMWGIFAMRNLGSTLKGMAKGVQAWANLTISEYEYDEKTGKMVEVDRVKLTESDFDNVAYGMKKVIGAVANPLAEVGKADAGKGSGFWSKTFGGSGYVRKGVKALQGVGNILTGLAKGVQDFANLTITKWETVENADGTMELKEVSRKKLSEKDFTNATNNIDKVIGLVARQFAKVGKAEDESSGWFSGGFVSKGIDALQGVGNILNGLAKGVKSFANLTISKWKVVTDADGNNEIKEVSRESMKDTDFINASTNIQKVLGVVTKEFAKVGKAEDESSGWFSGGFVSKGIEALSGIGDVITGLAKGVRGFASMEFITHKVKDIDGVPTLVPDGVFKLGPDEIKLAGKNMGEVLTVTVKAILDFAKKYEKKTDLVEKSLSFIGTINSKVSELGKSMSTLAKGMSKISAFDKFSANISSFLEAFINPFDPKNHGDIGEISENFTIFTKDVNRLSKAAKKMKSIDKSFEGVAKSMGTFKDNVNALSPELLGETKGLFEAMAIIAESGSAEEIIAKYGATLNETFENLADLLEDFGGKVTDNTSQTSNAIAEQTKSNESLSETLKREQKQKEAAPPAVNAQNGNLAIQLDEIATILRGTLKVQDKGNMFG